MSYQIKHMGLGGILDQAIAIVRDKFVLLFSIMLMTLIPVLLVQSFVMLAITPTMPPNPTLEDRMEFQRAIMQHFPLIAAMTLFYWVVAMPLANAGVIQAVARSYLGQPVTAIEALKHALRRLLPLIGTTILMYLAIGGGFLLLFIPGIYFAIWFGLSQHVTVIESISGPKALKRSKKLVHKDRGTFLALAIIVMVISFMVSIGVQYIPQPHVRLVVAVFIQAFTVTLSAAAFVVFYFSSRCGVENFDLQYLAEQIDSEPTERESAAFQGMP